MSQNPMMYNGGTMLAMAGKDCVAIGSDLKIGKNFFMISNTWPKVFKIQDNILLGLTGLATDVQTFAALMQYKVNLYNLRQDKPMKPTTFANLVCHSLFQKRFGGYLVQPIVIGIQNGKPVICTSDSIGAMCINQPIVSSGTGSQSAYGCLQAFWHEDMDKNELRQAVQKSINAICDRDILSGWGTCVYMISKDGIQSYKCQNTSRS